MLRVVREDRASVGEVVAAVESDVALVITVLRIANRNGQRKKGKIASIPEAVEILSPEGVETLAARSRHLRLLRAHPGLGRAARALPPARRGHPGRRRPAGPRARLRGPRRAALLGAAARHRQARAGARLPGLPGADPRQARTPEERVHRERRELGVDHALVGGVLARRWGLPEPLATAIERHHADDAEGEAAMVRLADMLAHYGHAQAVDPKALLQAARACELSHRAAARGHVRAAAGRGHAKRHVDPCPLSAREVDVLKRLAEGKVYKQIAHELELSTSTVRTHLHNTYAKLGAVDRAQAVLIATERGWI